MPTATPLTAEDLAAIRARAGAATPGPWHASDGTADGFEGSWDVTGPDDCGIASTADTAEVAKFRRDKEANAEFIAHCRDDVPALLADIGEARKSLNQFAREIIKVMKERLAVEAERDAWKFKAEAERWIPVSERLPASLPPSESGWYRATQVQVFAPDWEQPICVGQHWPHGAWTIDKASGEQRVTHWRSLPLPPTPEKEK